MYIICTNIVYVTYEGKILIVKCIYDIFIYMYVVKHSGYSGCKNDGVHDL